MIKLSKKRVFLLVSAVWFYDNKFTYKLRCANPSDLQGEPSKIARVSFHNGKGGIGSRTVNIEAIAEFPVELYTLALGCPISDPVIDWIMENAKTPEQKEVVKCIEKYILG